ncbi:MAG: alkaline phosphatase family protein [Acidobacteria bacterium]|nr:alkaline phosphatase family protein [Acidobacteriota bacterium]
MRAGKHRVNSSHFLAAPYRSRFCDELRLGLALACLLAVTLAWPLPAAAYVGPGAGFAFVSSFFSLFLALVYSMLALLLWPLRRLIRLLRRQPRRAASVRRAVIVGLDGLDPDLASRYMSEGKLPHLAELRQRGTFRPLQTTCPPISPVAWSTFLTGVNPGKHNIFDFMARDPASYMPRLSSAEIRGPRRTLPLGKYRLPLGRPRVRLLRKAKPFWHFLADAGIFSAVIRVPVTFPPEKFSGVLLSGMCVPDLRGTQGTFSFYVSEGEGGTAAGDREEGLWLPLEGTRDGFRAYLLGPEHPLLPGRGKELRVPFHVRPEPEQRRAILRIQREKIVLQQGEFSPWIAVRFAAGPGLRTTGICRFYLKQTAPRLELYASPIQIDPRKPALPISHPFAYSVYLGKLLGPYSTVGLAEDTWALNLGALDDAAFRQQCTLIHEERERMFFDALEKTREGACVCVFDIPDRIQHMFWRYLEPGHPAAVGEPPSGRCGQAIEEMYRRMDDLVGRILKKIDEETLLLVISDHGFKSFSRGVNINSWLWQNGYLSLRDGCREGAEWLKDVDWEKTRAYALGLNGLYVNQRGRERRGIVSAGAETASLKEALRRQLKALADPAGGRAAIRNVFDSRMVYNGPYVENAPDLLIGYAPGYRASWDSVKGKPTATVFEDNCRRWSGDHCIDPETVPGVLFSNWKIDSERPALVDVAPTVLSLFGLEIPGHMDGKVWKIADRNDWRLTTDN